MSRSPLRRAEKILLVSTVLLSVPALVLGWIYEKQNELPPAPRVEPQIPPTPNAFDLILAAGNQTTALAPGKFLKGKGCIANGIDWEASCDLSKEPRPYTRAYDLRFPLRPKQTYLQANQKALQLWRQSLAMPLFVPDDLPNPQYRAWNRRYWVMNAVRTQARADWQSGKTGEALDWLLLWHQDVCRSTLSFYNGKNHPKNIYSLNGSTKRRGQLLEELERLKPYLNASQLRRAALKLQDNRALLPSRIAALQISRNAKLAFARQVCEKNDLRCYYDLEHPETVNPANMGIDSTEQLRFRWANKKAGLKRIEAQWNWIIAQNQLPTQNLSETMSESLQIDSSDVFNNASTYWQASEVRDAAQIDAREAVLLSAMAARAFALENGRNPRGLKELVPRFLRKVESDAFNPTHSLTYSAKPKTYPFFVLGRPIFKPPLPRNATPFPTPEPMPLVPEDADPPPPMPPPPLGYLSAKTQKTLPFLLYSVGQNGRDDGGMDFKAAGLPYWKANWPGAMICDDLLAPAYWFNVEQLEKHESDELNARRSQSAPAAPLP